MMEVQDKDVKMLSIQNQEVHKEKIIISTNIGESSVWKN
jgi:hypothetical protein